MLPAMYLVVSPEKQAIRTCLPQDDPRREGQKPGTMERQGNAALELGAQRGRRTDLRERRGTRRKRELSHRLVTLTADRPLPGPAPCWVSTQTLVLRPRPWEGGAERRQAPWLGLALGAAEEKGGRRSVKGGCRRPGWMRWKPRASLSKEREGRGQLFHCPNQFITSHRRRASR